MSNSVRWFTFKSLYFYQSRLKPSSSDQILLVIIETSYYDRRLPYFFQLYSVDRNLQLLKPVIQLPVDLHPKSGVLKRS